MVTLYISKNVIRTKPRKEISCPSAPVHTIPTGMRRGFRPPLERGALPTTAKIVRCVLKTRERRPWSSADMIRSVGVSRKKVSVAGTLVLHERYAYRGFLQIAAFDVAGTQEPTLKRVIYWDPTEEAATRPLAISIAGDNVYFPTVDLTKNVCELVDFYGNVAATYDYAPFGNVSAGTPSGSAVPANPLQWSSEICDSELDLVYYNYRHYSPSLGRFLSRDPIEEQGGLNLYAFTANQSVSRIDLRGSRIALINYDYDALKKTLVHPSHHPLRGRHAYLQVFVGKGIDVKIMRHKSRVFGENLYKLMAVGSTPEITLYWNKFLPINDEEINSHERHHFNKAKIFYNEAISAINKYDGTIVCGKKCIGEYMQFRNATLAYATSLFELDSAKFHASPKGGYTEDMLSQELARAKWEEDWSRTVYENFLDYVDDLNNKTADAKEKMSVAQNALDECISQNKY